MKSLLSRTRPAVRLRPTAVLRFFAVAALLSPMIAGCGAPADAGEPPPEDVAPPEEETETLPASDATRAQLGIETWTLRPIVDGSPETRVDIVGRDGAKTAKLTARLTVAEPAEGAAPGKITLSIPGDPALTEEVTASGASADPRVDAIRRDVVGVLDAREEPGPELPDHDLGAALAGGQGGVLPFAGATFLTPQQRVDRKMIARDLASLAGSAYTPLAQLPAVSFGLALDREASNDVLKVWIWRGTSEGRPITEIVLGFAGTRFGFTPAGLGDVLRDVEGQVPAWNYNPLTGTRELTHATAEGFQRRWVNQATASLGGQTLVQRMVAFVAEARAAGGSVQVVTTGHSLGGATAELAAYSLSSYLATSGVRAGVYAYSFNAPRIGFNGPGGGRFSLGWYADVLGASQCPSSPEHAALAADRRCLAIRKFARRFDPVSSVPLLGASPVWNTEYESRRSGSGARDVVLGYCPMLYSRAFRWWPHSGDWSSEINNIPDGHIDCMYDLW